MMGLSDHATMAASAWFGGFCAQAAMWPFIRKHLRRLWTALNEVRRHVGLEGGISPPSFHYDLEEITNPGGRDG